MTAVLPPIPAPHERAPEALRTRHRPGQTGDWYPCFICGVPCNPKTARLIHLCGGGSLVRDHKDDCKGDGCLAGYPVGPNCLRRHPEIKPYVSSRPKGAA